MQSRPLSFDRRCLFLHLLSYSKILQSMLRGHGRDTSGHTKMGGEKKGNYHTLDHMYLPNQFKPCINESKLILNTIKI